MRCVRNLGTEKSSKTLKWEEKLTLTMYIKSWLSFLKTVSIPSRSKDLHSPGNNSHPNACSAIPNKRRRPVFSLTIKSVNDYIHL